MELRAAGDQGRHGGDADVASHVARQVEDAGDLVVLRWRHAGVDDGVDGHEEEGQPDRLVDAQHHRRVEIHAGIDGVRHVVERN